MLCAFVSGRASGERFVVHVLVQATYTSHARGTGVSRVAERQAKAKRKVGVKIEFALVRALVLSPTSPIPFLHVRASLQVLPFTDTPY